MTHTQHLSLDLLRNLDPNRECSSFVQRPIALSPNLNSFMTLLSLSNYQISTQEQAAREDVPEREDRWSFSFYVTWILPHCVERVCGQTEWVGCSFRHAVGWVSDR